MAAYKDADTEFQAITVEMLCTSYLLRYDESLRPQYQRAAEMFVAEFGTEGENRMQAVMDANRCGPVEAIQWAACEWPNLLGVLRGGEVDQDFTPDHDQEMVVEYVVEQMVAEHRRHTLDWLEHRIIARFGEGAIDRLGDSPLAEMTGVEGVVWVATHWDDVKTWLEGTAEYYRAGGERPVTRITPVTELKTGDVVQFATHTATVDAVTDGEELDEPQPGMVIVYYEDKSPDGFNRNASVGVIAQGQGSDQQADEDVDPDEFDLTEVARILRDEHGIANASVDNTGGWTMCLFAGPTWEQEDYGTRYTLIAGAGVVETLDPYKIVAYRSDFSWGRDDYPENLGEGDEVVMAADDMADEAEIARRMAEFVATHQPKPQGLIAHADVDIALLRQITED